MYYPLSGIGLGQHSPTLWREHMHVLSRMRSIATPGHGFGTASGTSSFDVETGLPITSQPCISYFAHPDATVIHRGSPVVLGEKMMVGSNACSIPNSFTFQQVQESTRSGGMVVGWPNFSSTVGDCPDVDGDLKACAVSLTTTGPGEVGKAFINGRCAAFVLNDGTAGDEDGLYAHVPTSSNMNTASAASPLISGALIRRHTGLWKILATVSLLDDSDETIEGVDFCLLERQPHRFRRFIASITGINGDPSYKNSYEWTQLGGEDDFNSYTDSDSCGYAYNRVEIQNKGSASPLPPGDWISDQKDYNIGDWDMLQTTGQVEMTLDIRDSGLYFASFSRASQFMGDCWDL